VQKGSELRDWLSLELDEIIAIDVEPFPKEWDAIRQESQKYGLRLHFAVMDAQWLALKSSSRFDLIYSQGLIEHIVDVEAFLKQCASLLKPSGRFYAYFGPLWRSYGGSTHLGMLGYDHLMVPWEEYLRYAKLVGDGWEHWAETGLFCRLSWDEIRELIEKYFEIERIALLGGADTRWFRRTYPSKWQRLLEKYPEKDLNFRLASVIAHRRRIVSEMG
jgi:SAM-dependent methyltransferase